MRRGAMHQNVEPAESLICRVGKPRRVGGLAGDIAGL